MLKEEHLATQARWLALRSERTVALEPVHLTPDKITAELEEDLIHVSDLIRTLREGVILEPVPEMPHEITFSVDGPMKNFWIKLLYSREDPMLLEKVHIIGVSGRGGETRYVNVD